MDKNLIENITDNFREKSNDELLEIWKKNNRDKWSREAFAAVKISLLERNLELPVQDALIESDKRDPKYAPFLSRAISAFIDIIIVRVIFYAIGILLSNFFGSWLYNLYIGILLHTVIWFGYFAILGSIRNQSIGNIIMGVKVVNLEGGKPTGRDILLRSLYTLIPFLVFTWNKETFLHDRLSRTYVTET